MAVPLIDQSTPDETTTITIDDGDGLLPSGDWRRDVQL
jgi:hypothetical protein